MDLILIYLVPIALIVTGIIIRFSKNNEQFGSFKAKWYIFILLGVALLLMRMYNRGLIN